jgi:hypothetical protein
MRAVFSFLHAVWPFLHAASRLQQTADLQPHAARAKCMLPARHNVLYALEAERSLLA